MKAPPTKRHRRPNASRVDSAGQATVPLIVIPTASRQRIERGADGPGAWLGGWAARLAALSDRTVGRRRGDNGHDIAVENPALVAGRRPKPSSRLSGREAAQAIQVED